MKNIRDDKSITSPNPLISYPMHWIKLASHMNVHARLQNLIWRTWQQLIMPFFSQFVISFKLSPPSNLRGLVESFITHLSEPSKFFSLGAGV
jgi:hypothetical protein